MIFKRPWLVLLLFVLTLVFTISGLARVWNGIQYFNFLDELPIPVSPWYLVISGVIWGSFGLVTAVLVWWGSNLARRMMISGTIVYSVFYWLEQLFLMSSPLRKSNWPFLTLVTLTIGSIVILSFRHPRVREFFGGRHE
ncbi:MAG: hypothetical protein JW757_12075 [Anaerolineales bacterium]|nr:hypothetical protein [Anaerolineales bacterium]